MIKEKKEELIKNYSLDLSDCRSLTLISSESCNLNCAYCVMAKSVNQQAKKKVTEAIKQSFNDGTYLNNIKQICEKYNFNPQQLKCLDIWGQEPTLTLTEFGNAFKDFYEYFPNLENFFFSTNGVAFPDKIIDLAKKIDFIVDKPFNFDFQFSYDGYEATKKFRGVNPEIIIGNIEKVILELNKINFKHLNIDISFHNVLSAELINKFGGSDEYDDDFYKYLDELSSLSMHFHLMNTNPSIFVSDIFVPGIEVPYNATAQEGKNLYNFIKKAEKLGENIYIKWWKHILYKYNEYLIYNGEANTIDAFPVITSDTILPTYVNYVEKLSSSIGCGSNYDNLKIRYDGTLIHCQNAISMIYRDDYIDKQGLNYDINREITSHNYYPNLLKEEDELEVQKALFRGKLFKTSSFPLVASEVFNLLILLLHNKQIDESYRDYKKLFSHALRLSQLFMCWDNNLNTTGSGFGKLAGELRFYCNGFLDLVDEVKDEYIQIRKERNNND